MSKVKLPVEMIKLLNKDAKATYVEAKKLFEENFKNRETMPDGKYHAKLKSLEPGVVAGKPVVKPKWIILDEEYRDRVLFGDTMWLHNAGGQSYFFSFLSTIGAEIPDNGLSADLLSEMLSVINKTDMFCIVSVKEKEDSSYPEVKAYKPWSPDEDGVDTGSKDTGEAEDGTDAFDGMDRTELKNYIKENGLEVVVMKNWSDDDIRNKIRENEPAAEPGQVDEPEAETPEVEEPSLSDSLQGMDRTELKTFIKDNQLSIQVMKSWDDEKIREAILEALPSSDVESVDATEDTAEDTVEDAPEDDEAEAVADPDIEEMPFPELKAFCKKNGYHKRIKGFDLLARVPLVKALKTLLSKSEAKAESEGSEENLKNPGILSDKELEKFCKTQEISEVKDIVKNYRNEKVIAKYLSQYEFLKSTLDAKQKQFLTRLGLGHLIIDKQ